MKAVRYALLALAMLFAGAGGAGAGNPAPYSGTVRLDTGRPFGPFVARLKEAITGQGFNIVGIACATCAAKSQGVTIPGNRVFLFFKPAYAVRMLAASEEAGIEAPIRLYVTEAKDGVAIVTYRLPSHIFGAYEVPELDRLGADLDRDVEAIVAAASAASG